MIAVLVLMGMWCIMNNIIKTIGVFAGGLALGAVSGYFVAKKKYVEIKERQIEDLKRAGDIKDEYLRGPKEEESSEESRENGILSSETRSYLKDVQKQNSSEGKVSYTKYYHSAKEFVDEDEEVIDPAEGESPEEISSEHLDHIDDEPEFIDPFALGDVPAWVESHSLIYYIDDRLLTEDDDTPVLDPDLHVGDILKNIDFDTYPGAVVFVWNHAFDTLYEITLFDHMDEI